jgi:hypothetical protein
MWYCREEIQLRQTLFFSAASIAGAFSGLLAFAIAHMDGVGGLEGWRWIFIPEMLMRRKSRKQRSFNGNMSGKHSEIGKFGSTSSFTGA